MKRILSFILSLCFLMYIPNVVYAKDNNIKAKSVVLMAIDTKEVLYEENKFEEVSPASVTKIMTILLALEALNSGKIKMTDKVSASSTAASMGGSQIWLEVGETMTVNELLKAIIIASANDACTALGEYIAGSSVSFVKMMNEKVKELGLKHTNFENCTGLDDTTKSHYSCAYDLAIISCEVMKYENIVKKYSTVWLDSLRNGKTELNNTNKLVNKYNGLTGLKTGTTSNAGFCISATATRNGLRLVAVVLGSDTSDDRFNTAAYLLDYGFANYQILKIKIDKSKIKPTKVLKGKKSEIKGEIAKSNNLIVKKGTNKIKYSYKILDKVIAPVSVGQKLGEIIVKSNGKTINKIDVVAKEKVDSVNFLFIFAQLIRNM